MDDSTSGSVNSNSHKIESSEKVFAVDDTDPFILLISCGFSYVQEETTASTSTEKTDDPTKKNILTHFNFTVYVEASEKRVQQENHLNRLQKLRKELNHIKETDWQYDPIEKYIGQL